MKPSGVLTKARDLITDPLKWTTGFYARNRDCGEVRPSNPEAVCFCAIGACCKVSGWSAFQAEASSVNSYLKQSAGGNVPTYNDTATHDEVLAMFDRAIALAVTAGE